MWAWDFRDSWIDVPCEEKEGLRTLRSVPYERRLKLCSVKQRDVLGLGGQNLDIGLREARDRHTVVEQE